MKYESSIHVTNIFSDGNEIGIAAGLDRPAVPEVPEGQTVASFLRSILGSDARGDDNGEIEYVVGPERRESTS